MKRVIEVVYEGGVLRPLTRLNLPEGARLKVRIEDEGLFGLLKDWRINPQKLKEELRQAHDEG